MPRRKKSNKQLKGLAKEIVEELENEDALPDEERRPGMVHKGVKIAYTMNDLKAMYPEFPFTPEENIPIIFQGVRVDLFEGKEVTLPKIFYDIYQEHRRNERLAGRRAIGIGGLKEIETVAGLPPSV